MRSLLSNALFLLKRTRIMFGLDFAFCRNREHSYKQEGYHSTNVRKGKKAIK